MPTISKKAKLSRMYTNHCIRATSATALAAGGHSLQEIASVTGHRNIQSLQSYIGRPTLENKAVFNETLHTYGKGSHVNTGQNVKVGAENESVNNANQVVTVEEINGDQIAEQAQIVENVQVVAQVVPQQLVPQNGQLQAQVVTQVVPHVQQLLPQNAQPQGQVDAQGALQPSMSQNGEQHPFFSGGVFNNCTIQFKVDKM